LWLNGICKVSSIAVRKRMEIRIAARIAEGDEKSPRPIRKTEKIVVAKPTDTE
jgi:hypothetical protein